MFSNLSEASLIPALLACLFIVGLVEICVQLKNKSIKNRLIVAASVFILGYLDLASLIVLSLLAAAIYLLIQSGVNIKKRALMISAGLIGLLLFLKDLHHFTGIRPGYVPIGVSYYFFRLIALFLEFAKNPEKVRKSVTLEKYLVWIFFFPIFFAGPIQRYSLFQDIDVEKEQDRRLPAYLLLAGFLCIKFLIIDALLFPLAYKELLPPIKNGLGSGFSIYLFGLSAFLHAYMDLMIYTEVSKKVGWLLGFKIQENFNRPLLAPNISQFWQRYHMSLSTWTRDYVFFPLAAKTRNFSVATYASMMTMGLWHDLSLNWVAWALCHGTMLSLYNTFRGTSSYKKLIKIKKIQPLMKYGGMLYTVSFVSVVFIFVSIPDFKLALKIVGRMLGIS